MSQSYYIVRKKHGGLCVKCYEAPPKHYIGEAHPTLAEAHSKLRELDQRGALIGVMFLGFSLLIVIGLVKTCSVLFSNTPENSTAYADCMASVGDGLLFTYNGDELVPKSTAIYCREQAQ